MSTVREAEQVKHALKAFFQGLGAGDDGAIRQVWHPDARVFLNNALLRTQPLSFLLSLPDCMDFQLKDIAHVDVQGAVATARADYRLSVGHHAGCFTLVQVKDRWLIANWVDHGVEA